MRLFNSLVRVSRRVGGATDLLATEMRAVSAEWRHSLYEPALLPTGVGASQKNAGACQGPASETPTNFTHALGPT